MADWTNILYQAVLVVVTSVTTYLISRRKNIAEAGKAEADAQGAHIDNFEKASNVWQGLIEDLRREINEVSTENRKLKLAVQKLEKAITKVSICIHKDECPILENMQTEVKSEK